jgi:transcriptional regulator with XRE-family HTH domain
MEKSVHTSEFAALRAELRNLRDSAGLSQRELAANLKVPHSWVAKVETGERRIDLVEFCWFAWACGVEPVDAASRLLKQFNRPRSRRPDKGGRGK